MFNFNFELFKNWRDLMNIKSTKSIKSITLMTMAVGIILVGLGSYLYGDNKRTAYIDEDGYCRYITIPPNNNPSVCPEGSLEGYNINLGDK